MSIALRPARLDDCALLARIHGASVPAPWSVAAFRGALATGGTDALIAEGAEAAGMIVVRAAADESEILALAVMPQFRRAGIGRQLLDAGLDCVAARGARRCFLEVACSNAAAIALYLASGFATRGSRPAYYRHAGVAEDAVIMERQIAVTPDRRNPG
jgi:ribosomal-protein-alanine N-acetyltransferase